MGVRTRAHEIIDAAKDGFEEPVEKLGELVNGRDVWGWDDFSPEYRAKVREIYIDMLRLRDRIREEL